MNSSFESPVAWLLVLNVTLTGISFSVLSAASTFADAIECVEVSGRP